MISRQEILDLAHEFGLRPDIVEKDYVLGWLLAGIYAQETLYESWCFKGGTCLKKCYFETYRFSEDLDFTLSEKTHLDALFLVQKFQAIASWVYERSGIEIPPDLIEFQVFNDNRGGLGCQGKIGYRGPIAPGGDLPRIKLDLTGNELIALDPVVAGVHHPYSDAEEAEFKITAYDFEEVFAEKIRALYERLRPRDLYDVIHLYRHPELQPDKTILLNTLYDKCKYKELDPPTFEIISQMLGRAELESDWEGMLAHQLPQLPPFIQFWDELEEFFLWLSGDVEHKFVRTIPTHRDSSPSQLPRMISSWSQYGTSVPIEPIRFAAANRLCVQIKYSDNQWRLIEPYSLRKTSEDNLLLYAVKHETGEIRSYRVDRILGTRTTNKSFIPSYEIELTSGTPVHYQATSRGHSRQRLGGIRTRKQSNK